MRHIKTITDKDIAGSDELSAAEPRIAVNAVLFDKDENIALSYMGKYDLYTLPGGGVEPGEDLRKAVKREVWEEAGCDCEIIGELGYINENRSEHDFTQERFYYLARVVGDKGELHLTDEEISENTTVVWLPLEQALKIILEKQHGNYQHNFIQKRDIAALTEALIWLNIHDVPDYAAFVKIEPINKGWSEDRKYCVETVDGRSMLLRVSDIKKLDHKKAEYNMMERVYNHGVLTSQPLGFGLCNEGKSCYSLSGWLDGEDAEKALPLMTETEQYVFGLKAGEALRKIHELPASKGLADWSERYFSVIDERIAAYRSEGVPFNGNDIILNYLDCNRDILCERPQCFIHGDFHEGNIMVSDNGSLYVIDLLDEGFGNNGDPWYDLKTFGENDNANFSTGFVCGYFGGEPPQTFWDILTYYIVTAALTSIVWTKYHKPEELTECLAWNERNAKAIREGYSPLMKWYLIDFYIQWIDGIPYKLKEPFDFSFLGKYGKVFKVFDDQDSGNICFGVNDDENKYFIKFAGAPTERSNISVNEAIANLKNSAPIYRDLAHPNLIKLIKTEEIGGGFVMVFEWLDVECMGKQFPVSRERFMKMPLEAKIKAFEDIIEFHAHASARGYVAVDFYDGSIMYDFNNAKTIICDIDYYAKTPFINNMGRMWGSSRFMSPEEFQLGATIDEITNVYTMGATAFALFGGERDRSMEKWTLNTALYDVVKRAVSDERSQRQQSIEQLFEEWRAAK